ncbi:hypothetical protein JYU09_00670 [bacterium AH-315-O15]|nr:hypothetical protein [bacterium AH-315-O15]
MLIVAVVAGLAAFIGYRMVRPMNIFVVTEEFERPMAVAVPPGLTSLSASDCGACHRDAYQEWTGSMHAQAWTDPYFQVDFTFDRSQQVCLNCHTPLSDQQENLVLGFRDRDKVQPILAPNDSFDEALRDEGVTCAVCHVRDGVIIGPFGDTDAPHPTRRDPGMTDGIGVCRKCHVVSGERWDTFYRIPPCGTVAEIAEGGEVPDCTSCHMPAIERPLVAGGAPRPSRRHLFRGGHDPDTVRRALAVDVEMTGTEGGQRTAIVGVRNAGADHYLPTGTPDRHLTIEFKLKGEDGRVLKEKTHRLKRTIMWRPVIVDLWDTRLPKGDRRTYTFEVDGETDPTPDALEIVIRYHLLDEARRRRIGYENQEPISYVVFQRSIPLTGSAALQPRTRTLPR